MSLVAQQFHPDIMKIITAESSVKRGKNKMSTRAIIQRQSVLGDILAADAKSREPMKRSEIVESMRAAGFKTYNIKLLYRDTTQLNTSSTFIQDLCQSNYSAYISDVYSRLLFV